MHGTRIINRNPELSVRLLSGLDLTTVVNDLTDILTRSVHTGASVGFILPFDNDDARSYWEQDVFSLVIRGRRLLWTATVGRKTIGTVQLVTALPANQPHRAEVSKLLVHPDYRRRGMARALMAKIEAEAGKRSKTLLTLDTKTGDHVEPLYHSLGYQTAGRIPWFCLDPRTRARDSTTYMFKHLSAG